MDTRCVELTFNNSALPSIDREEVENAYGVTNRQLADLDWLLYNAPMEYTQMVLPVEMEQYLSGTSLHGLED